MRLWLRFAIVVALGLNACAASAEQVAAATDAAEKSSGAAGLYPSALLYHKRHHDDVPAQLRRIAELGFRRVQLIVTLHAEIDRENNVLRYRVQREGRFVPLDGDSLIEFRQTLREIFAEAMRLKLSVAVAAHLNSAGPVHEWRNHFRFDPLQEYDGVSYQTAMVRSIVDSAADVFPDDVVIDFGLCGEMGASVFEHAASYRTIMADVRERPDARRWRLGVSMNFAGTASDVRPTREQSAEVSRLLAESDLLGMSEYRWFMLPPQASSFAGAVESFYAELDRLHVTGHRELPLVFTEVGIGGGGGGNQPASTPIIAAMRPWEGVADSSRNPWATPGMKKFRGDYYRALLEFLAEPPTGSRVGEAFMWSELSWDPLDVVDQGFADEEITKAIRDHDDKATEK